MESMKRTFALLATMAAFALSGEGRAEKISRLKELRLEFIQDYVEEAAAKERLEPALLRAIIRVESNFNHKAVSPMGARGLMQLMPPTADQVGIRKALDHKNPRANILAGARYLRNMINQFRGDLRLALAAYNAGPGAVEKFRGIPPYKETRDYVSKVLSLVAEERRIISSAFSSR